MEATTVPEGTTLPPELQKPLVPVDEGKKKKNPKVLVAVDDSELSFYAVQWALDNLFKNSGAATTSTKLSEQDADTITIVHVMQPFQHYLFPAGTEVYAANNVVEAVRKGRTQIGVGIVSRGLKLCKDKMVKAESLLLEGDAKDMICQAAQELHVDLLVLGSRGRGMIKRALLGSVSDYCVHHAKCPVLIVKPPTESSHSDKKSE